MKLEANKDLFYKKLSLLYNYIVDIDKLKNFNNHEQSEKVVVS